MNCHIPNPSRFQPLLHCGRRRSDPAWLRWLGAASARAAVTLATAVVLAACGGGSGAGSAVAPLGSATPAVDAPAKALASVEPSVHQFSANGWYWNPNEGGTGFMFEAQGTRGFVGFFMYEEGTGKPIWYVADGAFSVRSSGSHAFVGDLRLYSQGQPVTAAEYKSPVSQSVGTVTIEFSGSNAAVQLPGGRRIAGTRFDFNGLASVRQPSHQPHQPETGWFWNPAEGGRGYALEVQNDKVFMAMFHYNPDGTPTWNVVEDDISSGIARSPFKLYVGGQTLTSAYRGPSNHLLGEYTLSFRNPCAGQVQFAGGPVVGIRRFVFGDLPAGNECRTVAAAVGDTVADAQADTPLRLQPGDAIFGRIDHAGDTDAHGITLAAGASYRFQVTGAASKTGTLADPLLVVYDPALREAARNNDAAPGQPDAALTFTAAESGRYILVARAADSGVGSYVLSAGGIASGMKTAASAAAVSSYAGPMSAMVVGRANGSANLVVDSAGRIGGTVVIGGTPGPASGSVTGSGAVIFYASQASGVMTFEGVITATGQLLGTWRDALGSGGMFFGSSSTVAAAAAAAGTGTPTTTTVASTTAAPAAVAQPVAVAAPAVPKLTVRARGTLAGGVGPTMVVRLDGQVIGTVEVRSTEPADYSFEAPGLKAGSKIDVVFTNDAVINGQDRNLYVSYLSDGVSTLLPTAPGSTLDRGGDAKAFDGIDVIAGQGDICLERCAAPDLGRTRRHRIRIWRASTRRRGCCSRPPSARRRPRSSAWPA